MAITSFFTTVSQSNNANLLWSANMRLAIYAPEAGG